MCVWCLRVTRTKRPPKNDESRVCVCGKFLVCLIRCYRVPNSVWFRIRRWLSVRVGDDAVTSMLSSDESTSFPANPTWFICYLILFLATLWVVSLRVQCLVLWLCVVAWKYQPSVQWDCSKSTLGLWREKKTYPAAASAAGPFPVGRTADRCTGPSPGRPDSWRSFAPAHRRSARWRPERRRRRA